MGLALADATIRAYWYKTKYMYTFEFNPNIKDKHIVERFANEIGAKVKIETQYTKKRPEPYVNAVVTLKNKHIVETMIDYFGGDKKDFRVTYPEISSQLHSHFIRGYFDGDGSLSNSQYGWELGFSGREQILHKIKNELSIETNITNDKSIKRIRIRRKADIIKIVKYMYQGTNNEPLPIFLRRKYGIAKLLL